VHLTMGVKGCVTAVTMTSTMTEDMPGGISWGWGMDMCLTVSVSVRV